MNKIKMTIGVLCAMLAVGAAGMAQAQQPVPRPGFHQHERHPEIRKALRALQRTRNDLANAASDFDGHKAAALRDVDQAIEELRAALASDRH